MDKNINLSVLKISTYPLTPQLTTLQEKDNLSTKDTVADPKCPLLGGSTVLELLLLWSLLVISVAFS